MGSIHDLGDRNKKLHRTIEVYFFRPFSGCQFEKERRDLKMVQIGLGSVRSTDVPYGVKRFVLWGENWEKTVDVQCSGNEGANVAVFAMSILLRECIDRGVIDNVEFVGDCPVLWARLRKMHKANQKSSDYCSRMLHDLLCQFKRVRFSAV